MSLLRRMFNRPYRQARAAEGAGDYRKAAALYVEAELPEEAANALLFHAARVTTLEERLQAYHDALRWLPPEHVRRSEVQCHIGLAVLEDAQRRGARSAEEKRRLEDAAERLERAGKPSDAATAWELLARTDDMARCLEAAGDIERLEKLLEETSFEETRRRRQRRLIRDYEMSMKLGARLEARAALRAAVQVAPEDASVAELLRRLEARLPPPHKVELLLDGRRVLVAATLPATIGRSGADVVVRGASVSRKHCEVFFRDGELFVRDLGSRNGTLVRGIPIGAELSLSGDTELGLGDDVTLHVRRTGPGAVLLEVDRGLDHGTRVLLGRGAIHLPEVPVVASFPDGHATLAADAGAALVLGVQSCALPVVVLVDDVVTVGSHRIEVTG